MPRLKNATKSNPRIGFSQLRRRFLGGKFALPETPDFIIHTGDLSQLSKPSEFDTLDQTLKGVSAKQIYFVPGEHDMLTDNGEQYLQRYGKGTKGTGWYSFDQKGVHFVGLVNVVNLKAGGLGSLGHEQIEWLEDDLKGALCQHSYCALRAHSAVDHLSGLGLGNRRQRTGLVLRQAFRFCDGTQRAHSSGDAEDRRQSVIPYRDVNSVSSACAGHGSVGRTDEGAGRPVAEGPRHHGRELSGQREESCHCRFATRRLVSFVQMRRLRLDIRSCVRGNKKSDSGLSPS